MRALLLPLGTDLYAVEIARVREVLPLPALTRLPHAPPAVRGLFNLHGQILPALDTGLLLGLGAAEAATHVVVVAAGEGDLAGLVVDSLPERATLGDPAGPASLPAASGRFDAEGRPATLLDVEVLVGGLRR